MVGKKGWFDQRNFKAAAGVFTSGPLANPLVLSKALLASVANGIHWVARYFLMWLTATHESLFCVAL